MMGFAKTASQGEIKVIMMAAVVVAVVEVEAAEATATTDTLVGFPSRLEPT